MKPIQVVTNKRELRKKSKKVNEIDKKFLERMAITLKNQQSGIGLSAVQVGRPEQYIVIRLPLKYRDSINDPEFITLINPEITDKYWQKDYMKEGCLSLPGKLIGILRSKKITFTATDYDGEREEKLEAEGILARVIQHEIDHLNGVLITDYEEKT